MAKNLSRETREYQETIARVILHFPDKGQGMVRYYGLYGNVHQGKVRKAAQNPVLRMVEEELKRIPQKGWAARSKREHVQNSSEFGMCLPSMTLFYAPNAEGQRSS